MITERVGGVTAGDKNGTQVGVSPELFRIPKSVSILKYQQPPDIYARRTMASPPGVYLVAKSLP